MNDNRRRLFLSRASLALLSPHLAWALLHDGSFFNLARAAGLPQGWRKGNAKMAHNLAGLYIQGKKGWFDSGLKAGQSWKNDVTGDEFDFVTHGVVSKKWVLARSSKYKSYFLVFRGTQTDRKEDITADLLNAEALLPKHLGGKYQTVGDTKIVIDPTAYVVPGGFLLYWSRLYKEIDKLVKPELRKSGWDFRVAGFSLGGVLALYAAWYLHREKKLSRLRSVYTFGAPACANIPFSEALGKGIDVLFRVHATNDPVPAGSFVGHIATQKVWVFPGKPIAVGDVGGGAGQGHSIERYQKKIAGYL